MLLILALVLAIVASTVGISMTEWAQLNYGESLIFGAVQAVCVALGYFAGTQDERGRRRTSQGRSRVKQ